MNLLLIITLLYIIFIIYIHYVYNYEKKSSNKYPVWREKLEINPVLAAYLIDENTEWTNLVLADILSLVYEGYVKMEKIENDYRFTKLSNNEALNITNHQMMSYNMLFSLDGEKVESILLSEFKAQFKYNEDVIKTAKVKEYGIKEGIRLELEKHGIIDKIARKRLFKYNKISVTMIMLSLFGFIISVFAWNISYMILALLWILSSALFYSSTNYHEEKLTDYGIECREKAIGLKKYVEEYTITEDKPIYTINIYDYYYIVAVAIGEAEVAENEFIKKEYKIGVMKKRIKNILQILGYIGIIIYYLSIIIFLK